MIDRKFRRGFGIVLGIIVSAAGSALAGWSEAPSGDASDHGSAAALASSVPAGQAGQVAAAATSGSVAAEAAVAAMLRHEHHPSRLIVRFKQQTPDVTKQAAHTAAKTARVLKQFDFVPELFVVETRQADLSAALLAYTTDSNVLYAEPDYVVRALETPNDPSFGNLWGLHNTGQTIVGTPGVPGADIRAVAAWDLWTGDSDFRVAVIDTGINYFHPDLIANIWTNPGEIPGNFVDDDSNGYVDDVHGFNFINNTGNPMDDHSHGSHVAGTIGGVGDNGVGVVGVNWRCKIIGLKFLGADGSGNVVDAMEAMEYVIANGIRVSNNSWGGGGGSQAMRDLIVASQSVGHIFVAAAGNDNNNNDEDPHYPSNYDADNIIAVAATTNTDARAGFSNYGATTVDLGAPGHLILSTVLGDDYAMYSGTSMATPHVAGVVALVMSRYPELPWQAVKGRILDTARPIPALQGLTVTGGVANAVAALGDCNANGVPDVDEIADGSAADCNENDIPDECEVAATEGDCNGNSVPDECDIADGTSADVLPPEGDGVPDECQTIRAVPSDDYPTIQSAIDAAENTDLVIVADGIYRGPGNVNLNPSGKRITIRSANGPRHCIIDPQGNGRGFICNSGETTDTRISGFAITNGSALAGGAFACLLGSSPRIADCHLVGNEGTLSFGGGAVWCDRRCKPVISRCLIAGNEAVYGGAITASNNAAPTIVNTTIAGNFSASIGGGLAVAVGGMTTVVNSTIADNAAAEAGGGIACAAARTRMENTIAWGNTAPAGAELHQLGHYTGPSIVDVDHSNVAGGPDAADRQGVTTLNWGEGNLGLDLLGDDPVFVAGPTGIWGSDVTAVPNEVWTVLEDANAAWVPGALVGKLLNPDTNQVLSFPVVENTETTVTILGRAEALALAGGAYRFGDYHIDIGSSALETGTATGVSAPGTSDIDGQPRLVGETVDMGSDEFVPAIISSLPPDGAIDARQPLHPDSGSPAGWSSIDVTFNLLGGAFTAPAADFTTVELGGDGLPPAIAGVSETASGGEPGTTVTVSLSEPIEPGSRLCVVHVPSSSQTCLGFLPGDANGDAVSLPSDVLAVVDSINGVGPVREAWSTDIDRSGTTDSADILRVIDLLNGTGPLDPWFGRMLP